MKKNIYIKKPVRTIRWIVIAFFVIAVLLLAGTYATYYSQRSKAMVEGGGEDLLADDARDSDNAADAGTSENVGHAGGKNAAEGGPVSGGQAGAGGLNAAPGGPGKNAGYAGNAGNDAGDTRREHTSGEDREAEDAGYIEEKVGGNSENAGNSDDAENAGDIENEINSNNTDDEINDENAVNFGNERNADDKDDTKNRPKTKEETCLLYKKLCANAENATYNREEMCLLHKRLCANAENAGNDWNMKATIEKSLNRQGSLDHIESALLNFINSLLGHQ